MAMFEERTKRTQHDIFGGSSSTFVKPHRRSARRKKAPNSGRGGGLFGEIMGHKRRNGDRAPEIEAMRGGLPSQHGYDAGAGGILLPRGRFPELSRDPRASFLPDISPGGLLAGSSVAARRPSLVQSPHQPSVRPPGFSALVASLKPWLWWKFNDVPASGTTLDYGTLAGPGYPIGGPHPATWPASFTSVAAWTSDGQHGAHWTGTADAFEIQYCDPPADWPLFLGNDVSICLCFKWDGSGAGNTPYLFSWGAGSGVQCQGPATFLCRLDSASGNIHTETYYVSGGDADHASTTAAGSDNAWHFLVVNLHNPGGGFGASIPIDIYLDGALLDSWLAAPGGLSVASLVANSISVGGWVINGGRSHSSGLSLQHWIIFAGGYSAYGPMLTAGQIAALEAAR